MLRIYCSKLGIYASSLRQRMTFGEKMLYIIIVILHHDI